MKTPGLTGVFATTLLLCGLALLCQPLSAQDESDAAGPAASAVSGQATATSSEISLRDLRRGVQRKQDEVYIFFNAHNPRDRLDILCERRRATGELMPRRECEPRFLRQLRRERTREAQLANRPLPTRRQLVEESAALFDALQEAMAQLAQSHEEFAGKLSELARLESAYRKAYRRRLARR